jgi:hypothetical protein
MKCDQDLQKTKKCFKFIYKDYDIVKSHLIIMNDFKNKFPKGSLNEASACVKFHYIHMKINIPFCMTIIILCIEA